MPLSCRNVWGHSFSLGQNGPVEMQCGIIAPVSGLARTVRYGSRVSFGNIRCHSSKKGFQCINGSGNGFVLSRKKQKVFNAVVVAQPKVAAGLGFNPQLAEVQERLASLGFYQGEPDGETGPLTIGAIAAFQAHIGQNPTGTLTNSQIEELEQRTGARNNDVAQHTQQVSPGHATAQSRDSGSEADQLLVKLGFARDLVTLQDPANLSQSVAQFQQRYGLKQTGRLSDADMAVLKALGSAAIVVNRSEPAAAQTQTQTQTPAPAQNPVSSATQQQAAVSATDHGIPTIGGRAVVFEQFHAAPRDMRHYSQAWVRWFGKTLPTIIKNAEKLSLSQKLWVAENILTSAQRQALQASSGLNQQIFYADDLARQLAAGKQPRTYEKFSRQYSSAVLRHHGNFIQKSLDEFTKPSFENLLDKHLAALQAAELPPIKIVQVYDSNLLDYNFDKQGFPLAAIRGSSNSSVQNPTQTLIAGAMTGALDGRSSRALPALTADIQEFPRHLPIAPGEAKALISRLSEINKDGYRRVYLAVLGSLKDVKAAVTDNSNPRQSKIDMQASIEVERFEFWADKKGEEVIATLVPKKLVASELAAIEASAASSPTKLFGQEFIYVSLAGQLPEMQQNEEQFKRLFEAQTELQKKNAAPYQLPERAIEKALRPEILSKQVRPNLDDHKRYASYLKGKVRAGASDTVLFPINLPATSARTLFPADPADLIARTISMNGSLLFASARNHIGLDRTASRGDAMVYSLGSHRFGTTPQRRAKYAHLSLRIKKDLIAKMPKLITQSDILTTPWPDAQRIFGPFVGDRWEEKTLQGYLEMQMSAPNHVPITNGRNKEENHFYAYDGRPIRLVLIDQGKRIEINFAQKSNDLGKVAAASQGAQNAQPATKPAPQAQAVMVQSKPVPFNAMMADLMLVREFGESWGDADYQRMMLARWHYEQKLQAVDAKPFGGRFFQFGQAKPTGAVIAQETQRYKKWAIAVAAAMPNRFLMTEVHIQHNQLGVRPFGQWVMGYTTNESVAQTCFKRAKQIQSSKSLLKSQMQFLQNLCTYQKQAAAFTGDYQYYGKTDYLNPVYRAQIIKNPLFDKKYSRHGTVGFRGACKRTEGRSAYCKGMHEEFNGDVLRDHNYVMDDVYRMDKVVQITHQVQARVLELRKKRRYLNSRLVVSLRGIKKVDALPIPLFSQAMEKANTVLMSQRWLKGRNGLRYTGPAKYQLPPGYVFDLKVEAAELFDGKTGKALMRLPLVNNTPKPDEHLLKTVKLKLEQAPQTARGPDIVGLQIGMSFDQADKIIRKHMDVGQVRYADRKLMSDMAFGDLDAFTSGRLYESKDKKEWIVLFDEAPSAKGVVLAITRNVNWDKGKVIPADLAKSLVRKYGPADQVKNGFLRWGETDYSCSNYMPNGMLKASRWRNADGKVDDWKVREFANYGVPVPDNFKNYNYQFSDKCKLGLGIFLETRNTRKWDRLYQRLYDKKLYVKHFLQSKELLKNGTTDPAGDASENSTASDVKL